MTDTFEKVLLKNPELLNDLIKNGIISMEQAVQEVLDSKNANLIYSFARNVEGLSAKTKDKLADGVIETNNVLYIYLFAWCVEGLSYETKDKLADRVIATEDVEYIYNFALNVEGLSDKTIEKLVQSLIELEDFDKVINLAIRMQGTTTNMTETEILDRRNKYNVIVNAITASKNRKLIVRFNKRLAELKGEPKEQSSALNIEFSEEPVDYSALSDEQLQEELIKLYQVNDIETIRKNKEYFNRILLDGNNRK